MAITQNFLSKKKTLPLCGNSLISFNQIEIFTRYKKRFILKFIDIKNIKKLSPSIKKKLMMT